VSKQLHIWKFPWDLSFTGDNQKKNINFSSNTLLILEIAFFPVSVKEVTYFQMFTLQNFSGFDSVSPSASS
jgi:hypothetical protein